MYQISEFADSVISVSASAPKIPYLLGPKTDYCGGCSLVCPLLLDLSNKRALCAQSNKPWIQPKLNSNALKWLDSYKNQWLLNQLCWLEHNYIHYACTTSRIWTLTRPNETERGAGPVDRVRVNLLNKWQGGCALGCRWGSPLHK